MNFQKLTCQFYLALLNLGYGDSYDSALKVEVNAKKGIVAFEDQGGSFKFTFTPDYIDAHEVYSDMNGKVEEVEERYENFNSFVAMFEDWHHDDIKSALNKLEG